MTKQKKSFPNLKTKRAMYPIITKKNTADASGWYGATIIRTPTYVVLPSGKEVFLLNAVTDVVETNKKNDPYIQQDIREDQKKIEDYALQLEKHDGKWFDRFSRWPYQSKEICGLGPLNFIQWVDDKGYGFREEFTNLMIFSDGTARFHGNLEKYSCAFEYDIIDKALIESLKKAAEMYDIPVKYPKNN